MLPSGTSSQRLIKPSAGASMIGHPYHIGRGGVSPFLAMPLTRWSRILAKVPGKPSRTALRLPFCLSKPGATRFRADCKPTKF